MSNRVDIAVANHGSLFLFLPKSDRGNEWLDDNVGTDAQWFGPALAVEHRYAEALAAGMIQDGLTLE